VSFALVLSSAVGAQNYVFERGLEGGSITAAEWKMLPEYCIDTQGFKYGRGGSPNSAKWEALLGQTFWDLHHYCLAIVKFNRAQRFDTPPVLRRGQLNSALGDFQYAVDHMPPGYILTPEILTYVGRTLLLLNQIKGAEEAFARAQAAKPNYWPAYSWWASHLAANGESERARAVVQTGLLHSPDSRTLRLLLADIDAKNSRNRGDQHSGRAK
jgi:tetratricopeptide (TPR) repeat protein